MAFENLVPHLAHLYRVGELVRTICSVCATGFVYQDICNLLIGLYLSDLIECKMWHGVPQNWKKGYGD